jgi:Tfp pilus assembly protein PilN
MRPINLIPPEERRGEHAPLRSGPLAYIVVAALVAVLAGVTALVLTGNEISEREAELARVESEDTREAAKAERLSAYASFRDLSEQRVATVQSLADSRFDWERVMRELSLILPGDVWLVGLTATATPEVSVGGGGGGGSGGGDLRASVPGPALELAGCATGQEAVAGFVAALKDIDGVTRVGVKSSELGEERDSGAAVGAATSSGGEDCQTRAFIAKFEIVVAFDAAPIAETAAGEGEAAPAASEKSESESDSGSETKTASKESGGGG